MGYINNLPNTFNCRKNRNIFYRTYVGVGRWFKLVLQIDEADFTYCMYFLPSNAMVEITSLSANT